MACPAPPMFQIQTCSSISHKLAGVDCLLPYGAVLVEVYSDVASFTYTALSAAADNMVLYVSKECCKTTESHSRI
jgi:hypothetical protein